ncbi:beta-ketoacyl-ACP synthase [Agarivorans sp. TSD2052]|uniref:beta-ketoacyl-ACP synthase n=1 Tax=Agarivorans sp. TSD2052 TaxID=2937286 RepID=UPI00200E1444|nr:beta-ketoacyl-ACP synthase [Agarivorans sp. TSD2052]UPW19350.1 beta-ketoacyl-ACP synthase [Agarivorans sp. TSD2052]
MTEQYGLSAMGIICALGSNKQQVWNTWLAGNNQSMQARADLVPETTVMVGAVNDCLPACDSRWPHLHSRNIQLLEAAILQIEDDLQLILRQHSPSRIAIVLGTSTSGVADGERALANQIDGEFDAEFNYAQQEMGTPAVYLQKKLGLSGPAYCISTACSSSAKVFASARNLLACGLADAVILGGVDSLCKLTLNGFKALESVAKEHAKPFGLSRDGINIGEGAAVFIMQKAPAMINLLGVGESADAYHMSAPQPEGTGAEAAILAALNDAKLCPAQIDYINLHGTATQLNDQMEAQAVKRVFSSDTYSSSTKHQTGHTLGAAGAIENALCWLLLHPNYNVDMQLPGMAVNYSIDNTLAEINLAVENAIKLSAESLQTTLSHSFAFGGSNAVVCLGRGKVNE